MSQQNYSNHARYVFAFHGVLFGILILTWIGAGVNLYHSWGDHTRFYSAALVFVIVYCIIFTAVISRLFALKAQDRAIRAEENLRHFALTGKLLPPALTVKQIIGLRFAPDDEFVALAQRAAGESLAQDDIKRAIKNWKADTYRV